MVKKKRSENKFLRSIEFRKKEILQVIVGASILAIPVGFTEETWVLGEALPLINVLGFMILSLFFISAFVYFLYHRGRRSEHHLRIFSKRVLTIYLLSFFVVAVLMALIQKTPWQTDPLIAFNRVVLVTFPSSLSAAVVNIIK